MATVPNPMTLLLAFLAQTPPHTPKSVQTPSTLSETDIIKEWVEGNGGKFLKCHFRYDEGDGCVIWNVKYLDNYNNIQIEYVRIKNGQVTFNLITPIY